MTWRSWAVETGYVAPKAWDTYSLAPFREKKKKNLQACTLHSETYSYVGASPHPPRAHLTGSLETPAMWAETEALAAPELAETVLVPRLVTITNAQVPAHGHCPLSKVGSSDHSLTTATLRGPAVLATCTAEALRPRAGPQCQAVLYPPERPSPPRSPWPAHVALCLRHPAHSCIWMDREPEHLRFKRAPYLRVMSSLSVLAPTRHWWAGLFTCEFGDQQPGNLWHWAVRRGSCKVPDRMALKIKISASWIPGLKILKSGRLA